MKEIIKLENILNSLRGRVVHWAFQTEYDYAVKDAMALVKALKMQRVA